MVRAQLLALSLVACGGPQTTFPTGSPQVWDMFPFDGEREWKYVSTDSSLVYKLVATCDGLAEQLNDKNVYTVHYKVECVGNSKTCVDGETLYVIRWSSDATDGVFIHAYSVGDELNFVEFDPPMHVSRDDMSPGDVLDTQTGGLGWTSTMDGLTECPIKMNADLGTCGSWIIAADAGDGYPLAGQWWAVGITGVAAIQLATDTGQWQLAEFNCQPDDDCDGNW